jgi:phosphate transport system substrate-binding protein
MRIRSLFSSVVNFAFMSVCLMTICLISFSTAVRADEVIRIAAATSLVETIFSKIEAPFEKETGIKIQYVHTEKKIPIQYFEALVEGKADAAAASASFDDWMSLVKNANIAVPGDITHRVIGRDILTILAHKDVGIAKLNPLQIEDLFTGKIKNWKEIGGADVPVSVYNSSDKSAIILAFRKFAMNNKPFSSTMKSEITVEKMREVIGKTPGAVAFDTTVPANSNIKQLETPPIGRPATLLTKGRPSPAIEKLINFIRANSKALGLES